MTQAPNRAAPDHIRRRVSFFFLAGVIDEHLSHGSCGQGDEVRGAIPLRRIGFDQVHKCIVCQQGRLKGVIRALAAHQPAGDAAQLAVESGIEIGGRPLSGLHGGEDL
jgi:hypothetical protein